MTDSIPIYLEIGKKRTFAGALDWPGWTRSGRDEASALQALFDYAARFAGVLGAAGISFSPPLSVTAFQVVERLEGNATTDFGAPDAVPAADQLPLDTAGLDQMQALMRAYWGAFDLAVQAAEGLELRKGPRGGGRDLERICRHVLDSEGSYLSTLGWKPKMASSGSLQQQIEHTLQAILDGLAAGARGELPSRGPRGGKIWPPRVFVRRTAWHVLDHTWEIEDRMIRD